MICPPTTLRSFALAVSLVAGAASCRPAIAEPNGAAAGAVTLIPPAATGPVASPAATLADAAAPAATEVVPREKPLQYAILYRVDARTGGGASERALMLGGLEAEYVGSYGRKWEFAGQVPFASQLSTAGRRMHFGNLYFVRKWRLGAPTLKFGQFVVPFSNLTTYDVHSRIIQSLFRYSLGVRIDPGVEAEGYLSSDSEWQLAVTTGSGPYRLDRDGTPLVTGRVSRKFDRGGNAIKLGLSAAAGTLPVFSVTGDPVSAPGSRLLGWSNKRRLALDAEIEQGVDLFRVEGVVGTDGGQGAHGAWAGWTRPLSARDSVEAAVETWRQPAEEGLLWGAWLGGEHHFDGLRTARAALRWSRAREGGRSDSQLSLTAQYVRQF
jgi:hypothetical protein